MARVLDRQRVIALRKKGKTYSEIRKELPISKSTLSDWLSKYPLTDKQLALLQTNRKLSRAIAIEKIRTTKQRKREDRLSFIYQEEKNRWTSLTTRELELAGTFLYWGEGNKSLKGALSLNNTDPQVLKFTLFWLLNGLRVPKAKIKVDLHLYKDMDINQGLKFWSQELGIPLAQFRKPYIKESKRIEIDQKGFGHGTCCLVVHDVRLKEKVLMTIKAIADFYSRAN